MVATEDRDLWFRIASRYEVALAPKVIAHYRLSPGSATTNPERMLKAKRAFIEKHYGSPGCGIFARRIALGRVYKQLAEAQQLRSQKTLALASSLRALAMNPLDLATARTAASILLRCIGLGR